MIKIIIGIPTYNGAPTIKKTFVSLYRAVLYLKKYIHCKAEIIFLLNGCTDNTKEIVGEIQKNHSSGNIRFVELQKKGKVSALNYLRKFNSDIISYIDDDILLDKDIFYKAVLTFLNDKKVWAMYAESYPLPARQEANWREKLIYNAMTLRIRYNLQPNKGDLLVGRCIFIRKERFPLFPIEIINEDQYLRYAFFPHIKKVQGSIVYYEGIYSFRNYFLRDLRIVAGRRQLKNGRYFHRSLISEVDSKIGKKINLKKVLRLDAKIVSLYFISRIVYRISKLFVYFYLFFKKTPLWKRTCQIRNNYK